MRTTTPKETLVNEARFITRVMVESCKLACRVKACFFAPSFYYYMLSPGRNERVKNISGSIDDIQMRLHEFRMRQGTLGYDADGAPIDTTIRLNQMPLSLEVNRPEPIPLSWAARQWVAREYTSLAGYYYDPSGKYPVVIDVSDPNQAHTLTAGTTGSGKSTLLDGLVLGFAESTPPDKLNFVFVDLDSDHFDAFASLPHTYGIARTVAGAEKAIRYAASCMDADGPRTVLVIDELFMLINSGDVIDILIDIANRGRKHGVHMMLSTQKPLSKEIGPIVKGNMGVRFCGAVLSHHDSNTALDMPGLNAHKLPGKGAFIQRVGNTVRSFQAFNLTYPKAIAREIRHRWGGGTPSVAFDGYRVDTAVDMSGYQVDTISSHIQPYPVISGYNQQTPEEKRPENGENTSGGVGGYEFPISEGRPLTNGEVQAVQQLAASGEFNYRGEVSMRRLVTHVYGSREPNRIAWVEEALGDNGHANVIKLSSRRAS